MDDDGHPDTTACISTRWWWLQALLPWFRGRAAMPRDALKFLPSPLGFLQIGSKRWWWSAPAAGRLISSSPNSPPTRSVIAPPSTDSNMLLVQAWILEQKRQRNGGERQSGHDHH